MASFALVILKLYFFSSPFNIFVFLSLDKMCFFFFYSADLLRPDFSGGEDIERLGINELLEVCSVTFSNLVMYLKFIFAVPCCLLHFVLQVVSEESKNGPLIILIKDIEKSMAGGTETYLTLKSKLEFMPAGVLIMGSHTQIDNRKEKVAL